jgi:ubiquinone/menaquinone biosynthesis C-methylase UbiE
MDYDKSSVARVYDRGRSNPPEVLRQWLDLVASRVPAKVKHIVDLGWGTGRYSDALARYFDAKVTAIDPSQCMLDEARKKPVCERVSFLQAPGEQIPIADGSADLVFMSMVVHHLADIAGTARECKRVLRGGGRVAIRNGTSDTPSPELDFFPGLRALTEAETPSRRAIIAAFEAAGFDTDTHQLVRHVLAPSWDAFAEKMALKATSFISRLPEADFQVGISALRAHAASMPEQAVEMDIDFFVFSNGEFGSV